MYSNHSIKELEGVTCSAVQSVGGEELRFTGTNGKLYVFYHEQDCCETVRIEDICGDLEDLVGTPIISAEELSNEPHPEIDEDYHDSMTWTFYRFTTAKGVVTVRWLGESNGYYSESVDFRVC